MAKIDHHTLRRRGFDLHIAALLKLRRAHGHRSFFDERGYVRSYAIDYLQHWLASEMPEAVAADIPSLHMNACDEVTFEELTSRTRLESMQMEAAHFFRDILHTLESEEAAFYENDDPEEVREAQMDELRRAYSVIDNPYWDRCEDEENVVYLR
jgi:hypothetical protein